MPQIEQRSRSQARTIGIASAIWAGSIFLSRIMGLVREQIIGRTLGASRQADLYFASFTLPDFLNYLLAAGALSIVFIPIFLEHLERGDHKRSWEAFSVIANFILLVGSIGIALLMVFARPLASVVAPGFTNPAEVDTLVRLTRIILPARRTGWLTLRRTGSRRICVGRADRRHNGAIRAAAVWLLQEQDALVSDAFDSESGSEALRLAVTSDHDRVLGRDRR